MFSLTLRAVRRIGHASRLHNILDRLGRSLQDLVGFLSDLHASGVDLYLHTQGIDTTTPGGKALFQMMGTFAEFERSIYRIARELKTGSSRR